MPDVGRGHRDVFREAAIPIHADDLRVRAYMRVARATQQASAVDDMPLGGHPVTVTHIRHETAHLHHFAGELVADDDRWTNAPHRPRVPFIDVHVRAAHAGATYADQHFVVANSRLRHVLQHETGTCRLLHQRFHSGVSAMVRRAAVADARAPRNLTLPPM